ncbi:MAG: potassium channel family protein [Pseudomonadota bacterium]
MSLYFGIYSKAPVFLILLIAMQIYFTLVSESAASAVDVVILILALIAFAGHFHYCGLCIRRRLPPPQGAILVSLLLILLTITSFAELYRLLGLVPPTDKLDYLYFSVVTFTTLGYGDISPTGAIRIAAMLQALTGYIMTPLIVGQILWSWSARTGRMATA